MKMRSLASIAGLVFALAFALAGDTAQAGPHSLGPVLEFPRWIPLGPTLINEGQAANGRVPVTGRISVVAPNPQNPMGDVWVGSASGGVWHGSVWPATGWKPMTDDAVSLTTGALVLDSCDATRCATVWVGTGENAIRRDTLYGQGVLKGSWKPERGAYKWEVLGGAEFARGAITKIVLDPTTADGPGKVLYVALSSGQTSNGTHSTVTTTPAGPYGIWKSMDGGQSFTNVLALDDPATDLEMDPQNPQILFAGARNQGIYRSTDGGANWQAIHNGIAVTFLGNNAHWPEIAVYRTPEMPAALLYAVLGPCPHPQEKATPYYCSLPVYKSVDGGDSWSLVHAWLPDPTTATALASYASYTHALTIHPKNPDILWYGGINLHQSKNGGKDWVKVGDKLHPDHHQVVVIPSDWSSTTGVFVYDASDGGLALGDGESEWDSTLQQGLAITQLQSVAASPLAGFLLGGAQDNGTNVWTGSDVWDHVDDGDAASTQMDLDDSLLVYDTYVGIDPERCAKADFCVSTGWPDIHTGLPPTDSPDVSWYAPLIQDPTANEDPEGQHPLYFATNHLFRSVDDGEHWTPVTTGMPLGGTAPIAELNKARNPITAVAVAPSNPDRIYLGTYDGQLFTTKNGRDTTPAWTKISDGALPGSPVTSIAVHPADDRIALVSFTGFGQHSVYRTGQAGPPWSPLDGSTGGAFAQEPVNTLLIEPESPFRVWAGTDSGVWARPDSDPGVAVWEKSVGLPNVAVYDLDLDGAGGSLLAATHGRGVWMRALRIRSELYYEVCCGPTDLYDPVAFVSMTVLGLDPGERCAMTLFEGARECATSTVDATGAALETDEHGFLTTTGAGLGTRRPMAWACFNGTCAGGVSHDRCDVSEVRLTCGRSSVRSAVQRPREMADPPSTRLGFPETADAEGSFTVAALLKKNGGDSTVLCEPSLRWSPRETAEAVLGRAAEAINRDESCRREGVRAVLTGSTRPGEHEDEGPEPFRLQLTAPRQAGVQLVTEITSAGAGAFSVGSFGVPANGSRVVPRVALAGRAAGGRITVTETSPFGSCAFTLDTEEGDAAETVATRLQNAFLSRETPRVFQLGTTCAARQNPRDAERTGATLRFPLGSQVAVESTDRGLAFTVGSDR